MPQIQQHTNISDQVVEFMEGLDDLRFATKNCVNQMEAQRKDMYNVCKKMIMLRDGIR